MAPTTQKASSSINLTQSHISNKDWTVTSYNILALQSYAPFHAYEAW